ncbi:RrF2 family transcriptional regulator [Rhodoligotrophos defluvii]|uniref:RrF2 family transcriptional regulator n=1 Tax=Rhodoligotrophos defluvii TaxID=2561934 RepID=UPI0010C942AA|nr:Rrf2 family transcriptional regulator [Rhodoligotrophos defluvii]
MISQKTKYALQAMIVLARAGRGVVVNIGELAEARGIPQRFLEQILLILKHNGLVASRRGPRGGYALIRSPSEITIGSILRMVEGPLAPLPCLSKRAYRRCLDCPDEGACEIRRIFFEVYQATTNILDRLTLQDAVSDSRAWQALGVLGEGVPARSDEKAADAALSS